MNITVGSLISTLQNCNNMDSIVHVCHTDGSVYPVLMMWDETLREGEGDPGEVGGFVLVYAALIMDPVHIHVGVIKFHTVLDVLQGLRAAKNNDAVVHMGGYELTAKPLKNVEDKTRGVEYHNGIGYVLIS